MNDFKVNDKVGAIVVNGQYDSNCIILEIKTRFLRSPKYLVSYILNVPGSKGEVLEFFGSPYPIPSSPSYKLVKTEWVDKLYAHSKKPKKKS